VTRIGFAYNQKPELPELTSTPESVARNSMPADGDASRPEEEPPSISDEFAEWDSAETIDAVADALSALGEVVRLEANEDFPELLRAERPDIVFNIAEGRYGVNREAHVPAICEFY
jgi:D-alanine-D-alanine ligase